MRCPYCNGVMSKLPREIRGGRPTFLCENPALAVVTVRRACGVTLVPQQVPEAAE
jgi:hypothetical protein